MLAHILTWLVDVTQCQTRNQEKVQSLEKPVVFGREITKKSFGLVKDEKDSGWVVRINDYTFSPRKSSSKLQEKLYFNVRTKIKCKFPGSDSHV